MHQFVLKTKRFRSILQTILNSATWLEKNKGGGKKWREMKKLNKGKKKKERILNEKEQNEIGKR